MTRPKKNKHCPFCLPMVRPGRVESCGERAPGAIAYICTRVKGHRGDHVACGISHKAHSWPRERTPPKIESCWHYRIGDRAWELVLPGKDGRVLVIWPANGLASRLIRFAPELLAQLKNAVRRAERDGMPGSPGSAPKWVAKARELIDRVEGRK